MADETSEKDALIPPYEGRKEQTGAGAEADYKAFRPDEYAPPPGERQEISKEDREGVEGTDTTGATPLGVGESSSEGAEEIAARDPEEWGETGTHGQSNRPYGKDRASDGVGEQDNIDPESPPMQHP